MDGIGRYVLSIVCTAILCGLVQVFFEKDADIYRCVKLVTGLLLTVSVIGPVLKEDAFQLDAYFDRIVMEEERAVFEGEEAAESAMAKIITEKTRAYILEKASALGADVTVEVDVSDESLPIPVAVRVSGSVSPYAKNQLMSFIQTDLGISEENQLWI